MHRALLGGAREVRVIALVLAALALTLALASAARADDQFCYGKITAVPPDAERDTGAAYEFSCRNAITGFALTTSQPTAGFDVSADVFDSPGEGGALRGDDRFGECEGDLPGQGFHCSGTYTGIGRFVRGAFDGVDSPCTRDKTGHIMMRVSLVVAGKNDKVGGPIDLGKPHGCPKAARAKSKSKTKTTK